MTGLEVFLAGFSLLLSLLLYLVIRSYLQLEDDNIKKQEQIERLHIKDSTHQNNMYYHEGYIDELIRKTDFIQKDLKKAKELLNDGSID